MIVLIAFQPLHLLQLIVVIASSVFALAISFTTRPYESELEIRIQSLNEIAVALVAYNLLLFTDFLPEYAGQDLVGIILITVITITISANSIIVTYLTLKMLISH